jgi:rod shape-determining protein MreC
VITPTGIVGKVIRVLPATAQVLEINDTSSGVGAILEKSRLQGILKGTPAGETFVHYVMNDEKVEVGEFVLTSGGDRIFPKGMPIGRVVQVDPGPDTFLNIRVKPAARLERLEEVLVVTKVVDVQPELAPEGPKRASEILAERLPTVVPKPPEAAPGATPAPQPGTGVPAPTATGTTKPGTAATTKLSTGMAAKAGTTKPATATPASAVNSGATAAKPKPPAPATIPGVQQPASASPAKVTPAAIPEEQKAKPKPMAENPTGGPGNEH